MCKWLSGFFHDTNSDKNILTLINYLFYYLQIFHADGNRQYSLIILYLISYYYYYSFNVYSSYEHILYID